MIKKKQLLAVTISFIVLSVFIQPADSASRSANGKPNFVVFLTDDQGWGDLGCYGHPLIQSPNLDKFARQGMRFTQCYAACSVCSPSRSSILTGRTPYRNGVWRWIPSGSQYHLRISEITVTQLLHDRGYATCHAGKWHLNGKFNSADQPQPNDHGYDWWLATQNNAAPHHLNPTNYVQNGKALGRIEGTSSSIAVNEAVNWLKNKQPQDKPFFITIWTHEPHLPIESAERFMEPYKQIEDEGIRQHHGNVTQLDHAFGLLMKALDDLGHTENTLVVFTSDNGPEGNGDKGRTRGSTGGLRGRKRHTHEGGIRVPGIIRWPGHTQPGSVCETPIIGSDFFPTICEILDIPLPKDRVIDGTSILPLFDGDPMVRKQPLYWRNHLAPSQYKIGMRLDDWKIVGSDDLTQFELYNIKDDWQETVDLAERHPDRFEKMKQQLIAHDQAVLADGPDWWKHDVEEKPQQPTRGPKLGSGEDKARDFAVVNCSIATKAKLGDTLESVGESFALLKLPKDTKWYAHEPTFVRVSYPSIGVTDEQVLVSYSRGKPAPITNKMNVFPGESLYKPIVPDGSEGRLVVDGKPVEGVKITIEEAEPFGWADVLGRVVGVDSHKMRVPLRQYLGIHKIAILDDAWQADEGPGGTLHAFAAVESPSEELANPDPGNHRRPESADQLRYWLQNMVWYHGFTDHEITGATGMEANEVRSALARFDIRRDNRPRPDSGHPQDILVLPYPGGRHPRIDPSTARDKNQCLYPVG